MREKCDARRSCVSRVHKGSSDLGQRRSRGLATGARPPRRNVEAVGTMLECPQTFTGPNVSANCAAIGSVCAANDSELRARHDG